ncbi:ribosomal-protein-alanine N-acetyltransferase [Erwinia sp. CPCC 100877]|nr:ribosomal-protein-alanine N-acetyltransferase [Erwinia sp. CPCC 100877]
MLLTKKEFTQEAAYQLWAISSDAYQFGAPWTMEQFAADINQTVSDYLVFSEKNVWSGFIAYHQILDEIEVNHVVVAKALQGQGLGQKMMEHARQVWLQKGIKQVFLEVRASNLSAKKLYEKIGFKTINCRKNYYRHPQEDGFVMCLKLKDVKE